MAKQKKPPEAKKGSPAWMATFSDLMTLLLCFFVLLFASSTMDAAKFTAFINSFNGSTGILPGAEILMPSTGMVGGGVEQKPSDLAATQEEIKRELEAMKEEIQEYIDANDLENKVKVEQDGEEVVLTFEDFLLFDPGFAIIKEDAIPILDAIGTKILEYLDDGFVVRSEGHTDNTPISTSIFPSNWELSASRAIVVAKYFISEKNFEPHVISAEGFGEYYPIATNDTQEGRDANRRVEIKIVKDAIE